MTCADYLRSGAARLTGAGIGSARLDCLILLEDATGKDRSWLLAHPEYEISSEMQQELQARLDRRAAHEPLAYIRGRTEFYGRTFYVDDRVLEPRPESETIISVLKTLKLPERPVIVDVGTGSGALAITAKLEIPSATVLATDIDPHCLAVARQNAATLLADIATLEADLLEPSDGSGLPAIDIILANLPYVPDTWHINRAAMSEPRIAIFGGPDGMDLYRKMFRQLDTAVYKPTRIITESLPPHHDTLALIAGNHAYAPRQEQDFIQLFTPAP